MQSSGDGTVIDELVVILGLDPRGFTQGQRQAIGQLRGFQQQANTSANQIQQTAGSRLQRFWQSLNRPIGQANQNLTNLGAQSNRVGTQISAGINQGSISLSRMTTAALAAYGAIKTVQGAVRTLNEAVASGAETGRRAGYAGTSVGFMSRLAIGTSIASGGTVPVAQTEEMLVDFRQMAEAARQGKLDENRASYLGRLGVLGLALRNDIDPETQQREMLRQIGERFKEMTLPQAIHFGGQLGFTRQFTEQLRQRGLGGLETLGSQYETTARQADQFRRLQSAIDELGQSWDAFIRKIVEENPQLEAGIKSLADWVTELRKSPEQMSAVAGGVAILIGLIGVGLVAAFTKAIVAANLLWATPLFKFLILLRGGPLAFLAAMFGYTGNIPADENKLPGANPDVGKSFRENARPAPPGYGENKIGENTTIPDNRTWWQRVAPRGWGGKERGEGETIPIPGSGTSGTGSSQPDASGRISAVPNIPGMTADERNFLGLVLQHESKGGQNVMNFMGKALGVSPTQAKGYTAQGYYQMLNSNWANLAPGLGITAPNPMAATPEEQTKVALALLRGPGGKGHWVNWNPKLAAAVRRGDVSTMTAPPAAEAPVPAPTSTSRRSPLPPWIKFNSRGEAINMEDAPGQRISAAQVGEARMRDLARANATVPPFVSNLVSGLSLVRSAKAATGVGSANTTNNTSSIGIGDIHVHTPATDAAGIARDMKGEVQRNLDVTNSNYGLQY